MEERGNADAEQRLEGEAHGTWRGRRGGRTRPDTPGAPVLGRAPGDQEWVLLRAAGRSRGGALRPQVGAVAVGLHQALGLPHDLELAVLLDLADVDRLVGVLVLLVHLLGAARSGELEAVDGGADLVDLEGLGLLDRGL